MARDFPGRSPSQCYNRYRNTRAGAGLAPALSQPLPPPVHVDLKRKNMEVLEDSDDEGEIGAAADAAVAAAEADAAEAAAGDGRGSPPPPPHGRKRKKRFIGLWAPNEERRLCLCVRALMPQWGGGGRGGDKESNGGKIRGGYTNTLDLFNNVDWMEVAALMSNSRTGWQCREKWFEVLDPSVNRTRDWEEEEDAELLKREFASAFLFVFETSAVYVQTEMCVSLSKFRCRPTWSPGRIVVVVVLVHFAACAAMVVVVVAVIRLGVVVVGIVVMAVLLF